MQRMLHKYLWIAHCEGNHDKAMFIFSTCAVFSTLSSIPSCLDCVDGAWGFSSCCNYFSLIEFRLGVYQKVQNRGPEGHNLSKWHDLFG